MFGSKASDETKMLINGCLGRLPADSVLMADAAYGIFAVAWSAQQAGHQFFLRLSNQRAAALIKKATPLESGENWSGYELDWRPTRWDDSTSLPEDASVRVRIHEWRTADSQKERGEKEGGETLYFVTDLSEGVEQLADLYRRRNDVEVDIRSLKIVLDAEHILARSPDTALKELMGSVVAYNLVVQFRRQAGRAG